MSVAHIQQSIEGVVAYLGAHPEKARITDQAATAIVEDGLRCRATGPNGATLVSDMPKSIGGGGALPTPSWFLRAALANCDATVIAMRAAQLGVTLSSLEVTVDSESDNRGLVGLGNEVFAGPLGVRTSIRIGAEGVAPERLREIVSWATAHSPVADAIRRAVPTTVEVEVVPRRLQAKPSLRARRAFVAAPIGMYESRTQGPACCTGFIGTPGCRELVASGNHHVPWMTGVVASGLAVRFVFGFSGRWRYIPGTFLIASGCIPVRKALVAWIVRSGP